MSKCVHAWSADRSSCKLLPLLLNTNTHTVTHIAVCIVLARSFVKWCHLKTCASELVSFKIWWHQKYKLCRCVFFLYISYLMFISSISVYISRSLPQILKLKKIKCCAYKISQSNSMNSKSQFIHISADELSYHVVLLFHLFSCVVCTVSTIPRDSWINKYTHILCIHNHSKIGANQ